MGRGRLRGRALGRAAAPFVVIVGLLSPLSIATAEVPLSPERVTPALVVAPPNSTTVGFAPEVVAITKGGSLDVAGADTQVHNLACLKRKRRTGQPLCKSDYAALGEIKGVAGVERLRPGTYELICQLHPQMTVDLRVVAP